jgi:hypothetical protein
MNYVVRPIADAEWPEIAALFRDLSYEQTRAYSEAAAGRIGASSMPVIVARADGSLVAFAALRIKTIPVLGRGMAWAPSGPIVLPEGRPEPDREELSAILLALRREFVEVQGHILRIRLSGTAMRGTAEVAVAAETAGFERAARPKPYRSVALDLSQSSESLQQALNSKWRSDLRFALKSELSVEKGQGPEFERRFLKLYETVRRVKGFSPDIPPEFHFPLSSSDYNVDVMLARKNGEDLAGIVVGSCARSSTYLFGATAVAGRPLRAGYALQWAAILAAQSRGCLWYDLGGIDAENNPDVARFKERMNGEPIFAEVWQAVPAGPAGSLIRGLEYAHELYRRR